MKHRYIYYLLHAYDHLQDLIQLFSDLASLFESTELIILKPDWMQFMSSKSIVFYYRYALYWPGQQNTAADGISSNKLRKHRNLKIIL